MKKLSLLLISLGLITNTFSQIKKGNFLIGWQWYINKEEHTTTDKSYTDTYYSFFNAPHIEKCIVDGLTLGSQVNLNFQRKTFQNSLGEKTYWIHDIGITPGLKYYYSVKKSNPFICLRYGLIFQGDYYSASSGYDRLHLHQKPALGIGFLQTFKNIGFFLELDQGWTTASTYSDKKFIKENLKLEFGFKYLFDKSSGNKEVNNIKSNS